LTTNFVHFAVMKLKQNEPKGIFVLQHTLSVVTFPPSTYFQQILNGNLNEIQQLSAKFYTINRKITKLNSEIQCHLTKSN